MKRLLVLALSLMILPAFSAHAQTAKQPDLVSLGGAYFDFDKDEPHKKSADIRAEYRWGLSMLPLVSSYFNSWDKYVQFHPYAGLEFNTLGSAYANGGWAMDWYIYKHAVFTWSEGVGFFDRGNLALIGSFVEFRSMAELGYRFDNDMRVSAQISHISNAGIGDHNPGAEIVGMYFHVPVDTIIGR